MARIWTDAQKAAINTRDKELLVSAAAGSGKTATLTERIIRSLTDKDNPRDISKMLIVTFTRAAAAELRQRIFAAITDAISDDPSNKHLASQLVKLGNAKICTIDSFYLDLIRENFSALGLPPTFRIADTAEAQLISKELMADTVNRFYDGETEEFSRFAEAFTNVRNSAQLPDILLNLYSHIASYPEGIDFLKRCAEDTTEHAKTDFFDSSFGKILRTNTIEKTRYFISVFEKCLDVIDSDEAISSAYGASFHYDHSFCETLLEKLESESYTSVRAHLLSYSPISLKSIGKAKSDDTEAVKEQRTKLTTSIKELASKSFSLTPESISKAMLETAKITDILYSLLLEFEKRLTAEKLSRGIFEFNDIRRYALKLLVNEANEPTEVALELSKQFTDIYIDEYQDVDRVQDMIFKSISNGKNRFMVGDIKQSIYGFRGAEPQVFAKYRAEFTPHDSKAASDSTNEAIFMSNNFRCDENIIEFTNKVCSYLFGLCAESIGYCSDDDLKFSKLPPEHNDNYTSPKVKLSVLVAPEDENSDYDCCAENNRINEAKYVANEILSLVGKEKKADGSPITFGDIAVLVHYSTANPYLRNAFEAAAIPFCGADDVEYFENPDVLLILSVLNVIDNPHRDIYLAATLRSPLFELTLDDLITIRRYRDDSYSLYECLKDYSDEQSDALSDRCKEFISTLSEWRDDTLSLPVDKLLKKIYSSARFSAAGLADSQNLRLLYEYARNFESNSFRGLYNFIEYINKVIEEKTDFVSATTESTGNKVSIMTIHKSKGLEFPVCFIFGAGGEFNKNDFKDSLIFDSYAGVAMKLPDQTGFARINTPMREAVASNILINRTEEEMRVLYVALTRARERLYVTASTTKKRDKLMLDAEYKSIHSCRYLLMRSRSYLEWILSAIASQDISDICNLELISADTIKSPIELPPLALPIDESSEPEINEELVKRFKETFDYRYQYRAYSRIPAKISVSRLSPEVLDESHDSLNIFESPKKVTVPEIFLENSSKKLSATERGTATHLFLQFCNFARTEKNGVKEELARLVEERFLPTSALDTVFIDDLERFFESDLFLKIKNAKKVIREQRFNILLPASNFSQDKKFIEAIGDEQLAVQGVIDLIVIDENGDICLYDYKTDRISKNEATNDTLLASKMKALHGEQLSYYKIAVERLFDKKCHICAVYSTHAAKLITM